MINHYFYTVLVRFHKPLRKTFRSESDPNVLETVAIAGYYVNIGLSTLSEWEGREHITSFITDGDIDWDESDFKEADWSVLDPVIYDAFRKSDKTGIWYKSGRILFPEEKED